MKFTILPKITHKQAKSGQKVVEVDVRGNDMSYSNSRCICTIPLAIFLFIIGVSLAPQTRADYMSDLESEAQNIERLDGVSIKEEL